MLIFIICVSPSKLTDSESFRTGKANRKNGGYLPVPCHTRASSTPVQMELSRKEPTHSHHRKFPSNIDTTGIMDIKKDAKKYSLDSARDRSPKKNASALLDTFSDKNMKRNAVHEKMHSMDESRLSGRKTTAAASDSNNSAGSNSSSARKTIQATPELLAELLKGSSEKLVAEQHQMNQRSGSSSGSSTPATLPTAVLKCLVSFSILFYFL